MSRSDWSDVERVLAMVIDLPNAERSARIEQLCANNAELRAEVEALVAAHERAASFMEAGPQVGQRLDSSFSMTGKRLGPYELLESVGHGGMGTVYRAERTDGRFQKQVAIKVALAALHSPELQRHFTSEQQILATLEHPNIAHLLDAGVSPEGIPYLVMEYVEGTPVNDYCRAHRLSIRERLGLFQEICSAVNYAHQHLVVHRDIKPGNILVTTDGTPKLLDFGIAKILDQWRDSAAEANHSILNPMTPQYASPEQARGGTITTATDIYSLGVVLYELLTDQRPYEVAAKPLDDVVRVICEKEPEKPSAVLRNRQKRGHADAKRMVDFSSDLDAIVTKTMRKDPQQRYASSHELIGDLSRYLSGLPVSAHRVSVRYVAAKFISRHKIAVFASAVAMILAVAGVTGIVWQARIAQQQREKAQRRFEQVRSLAKSLMFEVHDSIKDLPGATPARKLIVSRALEYLDGVSKEAGDDASLQRDLAAAYEKVGDVQGNPEYSNLGDPAAALVSYRRALTIRELLWRMDTGSSARKLELSWINWKIGICLDATSDFSGALVNLRKALTLAEQSGAAADDPAASDALSAEYWAIAKVSQQTGDLKGALDGYEKAAAIRESARVTDPAQMADFRTHLAGDYNGIAEVRKQQGQFGLAVEAARKSLATLQSSAQEDPANATLRQWVAGSYDLLGGCLEEQGLLDQALDNYRKAQKIFQAAMAADPSDAISSRLTGFMDMEVGRVLVKKGNALRGLQILREALGIFEELSKKAPGSNYVSDNFGNVYAEMGMAHAALGADSKLPISERHSQWREARSWYQKSLEVWLELKQQGKLAEDEISEPERLPKEIAKCNKALARLEALNVPVSKQ